MDWRRVVITGMGVTCPVGTGLDTAWNNLVNGVSGLARLSAIEPDPYPCQVAGEVRDLEPEGILDRKELRRYDRCQILACVAAQMALDDAGLLEGGFVPERAGVLIGTGIGGIKQYEDNYEVMVRRGPTKVSPFMIPMLIPNMASGIVSMRHNLQGPNSAVSTACATGTHAIGDAYRMVQRGDADLCVAGGVEAALTTASFAGFCAMRAMCTDHNDDPQHASRPFDRTRSGFVMGEGAGVVVLEEREQALTRGARVYAEVVGYGMSSDAHHFTAPAEGGAGAARAMRRALETAEVAPDVVDYINAHGTSTQLNDAAETAAIKTVFGEHAYKLAVSSTKSHMGHLLGGAGGVEAVVCALAIDRGTVPPTINYAEPDPECDLDYVPNEAREARLTYTLSNSFGFGGTNACLLLRAP